VKAISKSSERDDVGFQAKQKAATPLKHDG
jgi:hypothetical protein